MKSKSFVCLFLLCLFMYTCALAADQELYTTKDGQVTLSIRNGDFYWNDTNVFASTVDEMLYELQGYGMIVDLGDGAQQLADVTKKRKAESDSL